MLVDDGVHLVLLVLIKYDYVISISNGLHIALLHEVVNVLPRLRCHEDQVVLFDDVGVPQHLHHVLIEVLVELDHRVKSEELVRD